MNIAPYRAKLPDLPLPEKRHGGAFRTIPWERYPHPREKTVEVTFHTCVYKKKKVCQNAHLLFLCTKPRLSQAGALLLPKDFVSLGIRISL